MRQTFPYIFALAMMLVSANFVSAQKKGDINEDGVLNTADVVALYNLILFGDGTDLYNGHDAVDLGLPSGTRWATMNVGASKPEEYGDYYAWGEVEPKDNYAWETYLTSYGVTGYKDLGTMKDPIRDYVAPNNRDMAGTEWDVAHVKWGGGWKMPTYDQVKELFITANTTKEFLTVNGKYVCKVTSKHNGNYIYLPAASYCYQTSIPMFEGQDGKYWSSSPSSSNAETAMVLTFSYSRGSVTMNSQTWSRLNGCPVRPVIQP